MKLSKRMSYVFMSIIVVVFTAGLNAAPKKEVKEGPSKQVLARIGERTITLSDFEQKIGRLTKKQGRRLNRQEKERILDLMVETSLFAMEARAKGLDQDREVRQVIQETVNRLLANVYYRNEVIKNLHISEDEIKRYYNSHLKEFEQPEMVRASHILLRVGPRDSAEKITKTEKLAKEIKKRLDAGEDFVALVKKYSQDTGTRAKGGDLGFFVRTGKVAQISDAAFSLKPGEVSDPVRTSVGYHIIRMEEKKPGQAQALDKVQGQIRSKLNKEKRTGYAKEFRRRLEKKYKVVIHSELLLSGE